MRKNKSRDLNADIKYKEWKNLYEAPVTLHDNSYAELQLAICDFYEKYGDADLYLQLCEETDIKFLAIFSNIKTKQEAWN